MQRDGYEGMTPDSIRSYGDRGLALSKSKYCADNVEYIRPTNAASCQVMIMEAKSFIGYSGLQARGKSATVLKGRKIFQRHTYAPCLSYYTLRFPQDSYAGRILVPARGEHLCPGKRIHLVLTTVRSPCKRSQSQTAVMAWTTLWPVQLQYTYVLPSTSCQDPKDALGRAGSIDLSVPVPNMGTLTRTSFPCFLLLLIQLSYWGGSLASGCCQGQGLDLTLRKRSALTWAEAQELFEFQWSAWTIFYLTYYLTDFSFS